MDSAEAALRTTPHFDLGHFRAAALAQQHAAAAGGARSQPSGAASP